MKRIKIATQELEPGLVPNLTVTIPAAGIYECTIEYHTDPETGIPQKSEIVVYSLQPTVSVETPNEVKSRAVQMVLESCLDMLNLMDHSGERTTQIHSWIDKTMKELGEAQGFGHLMDSLARAWFLKAPYGAQTTGLPALLIRKQIAQIKHLMITGEFQPMVEIEDTREKPIA